MLRLIWIFRFAVDKCLGGGRLMVGGMALSAKMLLRFVNVALSWSLRMSAKTLCKTYFGLNDDLEEISQCIAKDEYVQKALQQV